MLSLSLFLMVWSKRHPLIISVGAWATLFAGIALLCALSSLDATSAPDFDWCEDAAWWMLAVAWVIAVPRIFVMLHYGIPFVIPGRSENWRQMPQAFWKIPGKEMFIFLWVSGAGWFIFCALTETMLTLAIMKYSIVFLNTYVVAYLVQESLEVYGRYKSQETEAAEALLFQMKLIALLSSVAILSLMAGFWFFTHDVYKTTLPMRPNKAKNISLEETSQGMNQPCVVGIFDNHDLWHFLSGIGLGTIIWVSMLLDRMNQDIDRKDLAVF